MRAGLLKQSDIDGEGIAVREYFPLEDHDEDV